ncbi:MAG: hypothetical protein IE909_00170 [Campylobacterales bacterium]|nr:hypothetical protein [Campylobacterales bacterium]
MSISSPSHGSANGKSGSVIAIPTTTEPTPGNEINTTIADWDSSAIQDMLIALEH